jgi:hypothetical protein
MTFDLHFTATVIQPLTQAGKKFLGTGLYPSATPTNYKRAVAAGLHVSFETAPIRDWVTQQTYFFKQGS